MPSLFSLSYKTFVWQVDLPKPFHGSNVMSLFSCLFSWCWSLSLGPDTCTGRYSLRFIFLLFKGISLRFNFIFYIHWNSACEYVCEDVSKLSCSAGNWTLVLTSEPSLLSYFSVLCAPTPPECEGVGRDRHHGNSNMNKMFLWTAVLFKKLKRKSWTGGVAQWLAYNRLCI